MEKMKLPQVLLFLAGFCPTIGLYEFNGKFDIGHNPIEDTATQVVLSSLNGLLCLYCFSDYLKKKD